MKRLEDCDFLARDWWDIFSGPAEILFMARSYEYARQSPERAIAVSRWRSHAIEQAFAGYLALYRNPQAPKPPSTVLGDDLYALLPDWPATAFHCLDASVLAQRVEQLCPWHEQELRARRFTPDCGLLLETEYGFERVMRGLRATWQKLRRWCVRSNGFSETHLIQVDWWDSDKRLLEDFGEWLKINRPPGSQPWVREGSGSYTKQWRTDLKALAALRLWTAADGKWAECPPLYSDESHWQHAVCRAEDLIARTYPVVL